MSTKGYTDTISIIIKMQNNPLVTIEDLSIEKSSGFILEDITFSVNEGSLISIFGPNGGGKTMLLCSILGLNKVFSGCISISSGVSFSYMPQSIVIPQYIPITTKDYMMLYTDKIDYNICEKLNIIHKLDSEIHKSSGGEIRKIIFASTVMHDSSIIILDEPEENLDFGSKIAMYNILHKEIKKGRSVLVVSHDPEISKMYSDHVIYLKKKMHYSGKSESIDLESFGYYRDPHLADFMKLHMSPNDARIG